jgi:UDP-glucose 4-epimerase
MEQKKVIVTGGAGFIGSHIVNALVERGYDVHVIDTFVAGRHEERLNPKANYHEIDIRNTEALIPIVTAAAGIFHLAALPRVQFSIDHPEESHDVNINGTFSVLLAAHKGNVGKVVYSASSSAYGNQTVLPLNESMIPAPMSPYALQKHVGEQYCVVFSLVYGLPTVSLRYFNVYGPGADPEGPYAQAIIKVFTLQKKRKTADSYR